jgi:hypothetical protein
MEGDRGLKAKLEISKLILVCLHKGHSVLIDHGVPNLLVREFFVEVTSVVFATELWHEWRSYSFVENGFPVDFRKEGMGFYVIWAYRTKSFVGVAIEKLGDQILCLL